MGFFKKCSVIFS